jgi:hypothetical protein
MKFVSCIFLNGNIDYTDFQPILNLDSLQSQKKLLTFSLQRKLQDAIQKQTSLVFFLTFGMEEMSQLVFLLLVTKHLQSYF